MQLNCRKIFEKFVISGDHTLRVNSCGEGVHVSVTAIIRGVPLAKKKDRCGGGVQQFHNLLVLNFTGP